MPTVKVKYFGRLRELLELKDEDYELKDGATLSDLLLDCIPERHSQFSEDWKSEVFRRVNNKIAVNKDGTPVLRNYLVLVKGRTQELTYKLQEGDEVAVLPPAGGG